MRNSAVNSNKPSGIFPEGLLLDIIIYEMICFAPYLQFDIDNHITCALLWFYS